VRTVIRRVSGISLGRIDYTLDSSPVTTRNQTMDSKAILIIDTLRLRGGWFVNIEVCKDGWNTLSFSPAIVKQQLTSEIGFDKRSSS